MKFTKTIIEVIVITDENTDLSEFTLGQIANDLLYGDIAGKWTITEEKEISPKECAKELIQMECDPEFMGINENGEEI